MAEENWDEEIESGVIPTRKFATSAFEENQPEFQNRASYPSQRSSYPSQRSRGKRLGRGRGRGADNYWRNSAFNSNLNCNSPHQKRFNSSPCSQNTSYTNSPQQCNQYSKPSQQTNRFPSHPQSNGFSSNDQNASSSKILTMDICNDSVGKVIGKGGSKIRELQEVTGARISIMTDESNLTCTAVEICGTEDQKSQAKRLIEDLTIPAGNIQAWADKQNRHFNETHVEQQVPLDWGALRRDAEDFERTRWLDCPEIIKHFYKEKKHISDLTDEEVKEIRDLKNKISVTDLTDKKRKLPNPVNTFEDAFDDYPEILDTIRVNKFVEPSPIQSQAWPVLLSGMDCIGIAQTGTGKTLAFLLPAFIHIDEQKVPRQKRGGPSCLILSPTRELAQQIEMEVKKFHYRHIRSVCIYGGGDRRAQINLVKQGVEIIIGTPGRLNDLLMNGFFSVKSVTYLVLDEADRMLDMGFEPEIKKILLDIRPDRQTIMTSATWPPGVQRMADKYLNDPIRVNVGSLDLQACHSVSQMIELIENSDKEERVLDFIEAMEPDDKLLIFVGRKVTADEISSNFAMRDMRVGIQCIHGGRDQSDREQALEDMKTGVARVLIATDVASRGLDIKDLTHVLNYDFPRDIEDYVHRIGRTGRAGRSGCALTFVTREDWRHVGKLIPIMEEAGQEVPMEVYEMAERFKQMRERRDEERNAYGGGGNRGRTSGNGCFKCGEEGHFSRECPSGGGRGRGGGGRGGGYRGSRGGSSEPIFGSSFRGGGRSSRTGEKGITISCWDAM